MVWCEVEVSGVDERRVDESRPHRKNVKMTEMWSENFKRHSITYHLNNTTQTYKYKLHTQQNTTHHSVA